MWLDLDFEIEMVRYWLKDFHPIGSNAGVTNIIWKSRKIQAERMQRMREVNDEYYDTLEAPILLVLRWKEEMSAENQAIFEVTGDVNDALRYEG